MKKSLLIFLLLVLQIDMVMAGGVIIGNDIDSITPAQLKKLYLGKVNNISGVEILLTDLEPLKKEFLDKFIGKSLKRYKKLWMSKLFEEGVIGPQKFKTADELVKYIRETPHSIGYVPTAPEGAGDIKVLLEF